ncbi:MULTISPECIES: AAA family ATPase [unclassified Nocardiopsis]|uniref:AAA family ATPase n=1 Tax=unclassified Nocardiopsis TaxID=2649073 RepID=UPI0013569A6A|nr:MULTISPECIES: AAA family ATPase [unclassified Nocardiopsis]
MNHIPLRDLRTLLTAENDTVVPLPSHGLTQHILSRSQITDLPAPTPLIDSTLDRQTVTLLAGPWGTAKSLLALDWAACLASGLPWQGRTVHAHEAVLYIAAEGGGGLKRRLDAWESRHGIHLSDVTFYVLTRPVNLLSALEISELCAAVRERSIRHVIIDTLARCLPGADENSARDIGLAVDALYEIREATEDGSVIALHHTGKNRVVRGSSALEAGMDTVYQTSAEGALIDLRRTKRKDGPLHDHVRLRLEPVADSVVLAPVEMGNTGGAEDRILSHLSRDDSHDGPTTTALMQDAQLATSTFYRALNRLVERGAVELVKEGRTTRVRARRPDSHAEISH